MGLRWLRPRAELDALNSNGSISINGTSSCMVLTGANYSNTALPFGSTPAGAAPTSNGTCPDRPMTTPPHTSSQASGDIGRRIAGQIDKSLGYFVDKAVASKPSGVTRVPPARRRLFERRSSWKDLPVDHLLFMLGLALTAWWSCVSQLATFLCSSQEHHEAERSRRRASVALAAERLLLFPRDPPASPVVGSWVPGGRGVVSGG